MPLIKRITLLTTLAISLLSATVFAQDLSDNAIAARIAPVGDVYLQGDIVNQEQQADLTQPAAPRSGESIYNRYCVACHATGAAGAPLKGDANAWQPRVVQGTETLIAHAISGFNAMPAKGTCSDCSDDEIAATVQFLIQGIY